MRIDEMTSEEFGRSIENDPIVIIPIGGTEAHGPHLPLGTDSFQPEYIAMGVSKIIDNVLVAPTMPYGQHSSMSGFPGTITLTFDTLRSFITDVLNSLKRHGVKKVIIISGHAGNSHLCAITEACRDFVKTSNMKVMFFSDYYIAEKHEKCALLKNDGHAGMMETSRILDIRPELVKDERPVGLFKDCGYMILDDASVLFPQMIEGDTTDSSSSFGKEINDFVIARVAEMIGSDFA